MREEARSAAPRVAPRNEATSKIINKNKSKVEPTTCGMRCALRREAMQVAEAADIF